MFVGGTIADMPKGSVGVVGSFAHNHTGLETSHGSPTHQNEPSSRALRSFCLQTFAISGTIGTTFSPRTNCRTNPDNRGQSRRSEILVQDPSFGLLEEKMKNLCTRLTVTKVRFGEGMGGSFGQKVRIYMFLSQTICPRSDSDPGARHAAPPASYDETL